MQFLNQWTISVTPHNACQNAINNPKPPYFMGQKTEQNLWEYLLINSSTNNYLIRRVNIYLGLIFLQETTSHIFLLFFFFQWPHQQHMEVTRLEAELELQPVAYATTTATQDVSCVWNLHHSSQQRLIFNPLNKARDPTFILMDAGQIC